MSAKDTPPIPATSYADRLKTNVRYDQRLKRNVLEITIEKTDKAKKIDLKLETVSKLLISIGLNACDEMEEYQINYRKVCTISMWVKKDITLDRFCQKEGIVIEKGIVTGTIRPAGR